MRRKPSAVEPRDEPPRELLRFRSPQPPPIGPEGRPMPWAVKWTADEFAAFLRARAAWRDTHSRPLPGLGGMDRCRLSQGDIDPALIEAEKQAPKKQPDWFGAKSEDKRNG